MLKDSFGRVHDYLRISLTDRCNLRCIYCMPENVVFSPQDHLMTTDEILRIAGLFVEQGVRKIRLTGGEPLVRKDAAEIISVLASLGVELAITTNGILLKDHVESFEKLGIQSVNISLDTLKADRFQKITRRDCFKEVIDSIHSCIERNFHVKVNVVLMRGVNDDEILDFIQWTGLAPIHVRFIEYMPFDGNRWDAEKVISQDELFTRINSEYDCIKLGDGIHDTARKYKVIGHEGTFAMISTMTHPFCGNCNRLRLTADGKMKNCLFSNGEIDLLSALRNGEDIVPLIRTCVYSKKAERGGQLLDLEKMHMAGSIQNRSMVRIGG